MSILLFGMSGGIASAPAVSTDSIRERIMQDLRLRLESIQSVGSESAAAGNTPGVRYAASATYTGTVTRQYQIQVVTGGASGVAAVTITDVTPADQRTLWPAGTADDNGSVAAVVTSGTAFNVGTLGVQMTLTWTGNLASGDTWFVWAGTYTRTVDQVIEVADDDPSVPVWIEIGTPTEDPVEGPVQKISYEMDVTLLCSIERTPDPKTEISELIAAVKKAVVGTEIARTRSGLAIDTELLGSAGFALGDTKSRSGFEMTLLIHYRHALTDPHTL